MPKVLDTASYIDALLDLLDQGRTDVPLTIAGSSMKPFLRSGDTVWLNRPVLPVKPGQIILFRRSGGSYVLHRVHKVRPDGSLLLLGDSQFRPEPVLPDQVLAIATAAAHDGRPMAPGGLRWTFYATLWRWLAPARPAIVRLWGMIKNR